jgi:pimeloyl-ACP methyl ester carboxylesterase
MNIHDSLTLPDGRRLAYAQYGDPAGTPVMYFHGSPSSRLEPALIGGETWHAVGLRIICPDRPGIGESTFKAGRRFIDWPADVVALADHLRLPRFAVLANSGGAPYAAVCAVLISHRITRVVIVSGGWRMDLPEAKAGMALPNKIFLGLVRYMPPLARLMLGAMAQSSEEDPARELANLKGRVPDVDLGAFSAPGRIAAFHASMKECVKFGTHGAAADLGLYMRSFGFDPHEVKLPIILFHGEKDVNAPMPLAKRMSRELPGAQLVACPDDAHLSTLCNHLEKIAAALKR